MATTRRHYRLTHPDVDAHKRDGRYVATADIAEDSRDVGVGDTPQQAVKAALEALGEPYVSEMAKGVNLT
jgi:hypothetical protein